MLFEYSISYHSDFLLPGEGGVSFPAGFYSFRIDFGEDGDTDWFALNDDVMGGVSTSNTYLGEETILFSGEVSRDLSSTK